MGAGVVFLLFFPIKMALLNQYLLEKVDEEIMEEQPRFLILFCFSLRFFVSLEDIMEIVRQKIREHISQICKIYCMIMIMMILIKVFKKVRDCDLG
jgi:UDP-N-acetylmuramyl pentapeptide phosphotransferase/UDP-N-acetylglucosamine-1-phosphate transferase